jgi:hypothetical protein
MIPIFGRGHSEAVLPLFKEEPLGSWRVSGEHQLPSIRRSGYAAKYNYGEIVSRLKADYSDQAELQRLGRGIKNQDESTGYRLRRS